MIPHMLAAVGAVIYFMHFKTSQKITLCNRKWCGAIVRAKYKFEKGIGWQRMYSCEKLETYRNEFPIKRVYPFETNIFIGKNVHSFLC